MSFLLVVAEKPSVARDIARVLGAKGRGEGCLTGGKLDGHDVTVSWCVGHLAQLAPPERYDPAWKAWRAETLPMLPAHFELEPRREGGDQWKALRKLLRDKELGGVINACDAGREGELIFAYAYELAGCRASVQRLWVSSMTDGALRDGLARLRPGTELAALESAARARSEADWLVGLNATRAMTLHVRALTPDGPLLSVGRVQTPTLAILVDREVEIEAFVVEDFYQVKAELEADAGRWEAIWVAPAEATKPEEGGEPLGEDEEEDADGDKGSGPVAGRRDRLATREEAEAVVARLKGKDAEVVYVARKEARERAPLLYDLTALQREANRRFKLSAARTLEIAQSLYETHKLLTYPRTDSRHLSTAVAETLPDVLRSLRFGPYGEAADHALSAAPLGRRFVDDAEVGDHHAIIPTGVDPRSRNLDREEKLVFDLVARRLLGAYAGDAVFATAHVVAAVGEDRLHARGRTLVEPGYRAIDPPRTKGKEKLLPAVEVGTPAKVRKAKVHDGKTRPPPRHSEASLLGAMERAGETLDDEELARAMKARGLGTPATRAAILETLLQRGYIVRDGQHLVPTQQGRRLLAILPEPALRSPQLTGAWEARLVAIAEGRESYDAFARDVRAFVGEVCRNVLGAAPSEAAQALAAEANASGDLLGRCPRCEAEVRSRRFGWSCSGCGLRIPDKVAKRTVSAKMAKALLTSGATDVVKGFRSKKGNEFSAALRLDPERGVVFDFSEVPREPPAGGRPAPAGQGVTASAVVGRPCPLCADQGGRLIRGRAAYGCARWREGCRFQVEFTLHGVDVQGALPGLLEQGVSAPLRGEDGRPFRLAIDRSQLHGVRIEHPRLPEGPGRR
ncbi:MAG: hypothetical protein RIT45_3997 [Pseudomonadota bacterium]